MHAVANNICTVQTYVHVRTRVKSYTWEDVCDSIL